MNIRPKYAICAIALAIVLAGLGFYYLGRSRQKSADDALSLKQRKALDAFLANTFSKQFLGEYNGYKLHAPPDEHWDFFIGDAFEYFYRSRYIDPELKFPDLDDIVQVNFAKGVISEDGTLRKINVPIMMGHVSFSDNGTLNPSVTDGYIYYLDLAALDDNGKITITRDNYQAILRSFLDFLCAKSDVKLELAGTVTAPEIRIIDRRKSEPVSKP